MTIFGVALFTGHPDTVSVGGFIHNQIPVTFGNILGGAFFGLVYWYATWADSNDDMKFIERKWLNREVDA